MSDFKTYPEEAEQVRELIDRRRHFLNLIYAMILFATFQISLSAGWFAYVFEAYYHMTDSGLFMLAIAIIGQFIAIVALYGALFLKRNALLVFLILLYFAAACVKLVEISSISAGSQHRSRFSRLSRLSEFALQCLIYNTMMCTSSFINALLAAMAVWHFTPLVVVKMNWKNAKRDAEKSLKKVLRKQGAKCNVTSSQSNDSLDITELRSGKSYSAKVARKRSTKVVIGDDAKVRVTNTIRAEKDLSRSRSNSKSRSKSKHSGKVPR